MEKIIIAMEQKFSIRQEVAQEGSRRYQQPQYPEPGSEEYLTWLHPQLTEAKNCSDFEKYVPMAYLSKLNEALMVNEDLRAKEAMVFLQGIQEELEREQDCSGQTGKKYMSWTIQV